jgi:hypothetical protein
MKQWQVSENMKQWQVSENTKQWQVSENMKQWKLSENMKQWKLSENMKQWHVSENAKQWQKILEQTDVQILFYQNMSPLRIRLEKVHLMIERKSKEAPETTYLELRISAEL